MYANPTYKSKYFASSDVYFPFGLVVRIPGFHPGGPGSIPGVGMRLFFFFGGTSFDDEFSMY